jgi:hypothetical protein
VLRSQWCQSGVKKGPAKIQSLLLTRILPKCSQTRNHQAGYAYSSQITKHTGLRFRALLTDSERQVRFERLTG